MSLQTNPLAFILVEYIKNIFNIDLKDLNFLRIFFASNKLIFQYF